MSEIISKFKSKFKQASTDAELMAADCLFEARDTGVATLNFFERHGKLLRIAGFMLLGLLFSVIFAFGFPEVVLASTPAPGPAPGDAVFGRANTAMQGVLRQVRLISSIVAALFLTLAFLLKMFSKNQRTVDEANTWIKRIAIAWACINAVGFILTFIQEIIGPDVALPTIG